MQARDGGYVLELLSSLVTRAWQDTVGGPPCPVGSVQRGIYEVVNGPRDRGQSWALKLMFRVTISANRISQKPVACAYLGLA